MKECYYYLDSTPTHSYMKCLYKYPQAEFPYARLVEKISGARTRDDPEFELLDTGMFDEDRYFDVFVEYAKADANDILIRIAITNRGPDAAPPHVLPTVWFRNAWSWNPGAHKPMLSQGEANLIKVEHETLGSYQFMLGWASHHLLFTENKYQCSGAVGRRNAQPWVKDAFHEYVIRGRQEAVNSAQQGTKACAWYHFTLAPGQTEILHLRLAASAEPSVLVHDLEGLFAERIAEADEFYSFCPTNLSEDGKRVQRQAFAGLLWSKQYYNYVVDRWLKGDPGQPIPPESRLHGRNAQWIHLFNEDVLSMPDKWEYPWYAAWDLAFPPPITLSLVDPGIGQIAAQIVSARMVHASQRPDLPPTNGLWGDVNPPVHAWACWRVFQIDRKYRGAPD